MEWNYGKERLKGEEETFEGKEIIGERGEITGEKKEEHREGEWGEECEGDD